MDVMKPEKPRRKRRILTLSVLRKWNLRLRRSRRSVPRMRPIMLRGPTIMESIIDIGSGNLARCL